MANLAHKTAVITGATSGIGAAYAARFAKEGYDLVITGRRREKIEAFSERLRKENGVNVEVVLAELSEKTDIQALTERLHGRQVEILVNNAGFGYKSLYQICDLRVIEQMAKVKILAPMVLIRSVLPEMLERGRGTIINVSSLSAYLIIPRNSVYSGVNSFLKSFTKGLSLDLIDTGVKVQVVCPGLTWTDFHEKIGIEKSKQQNKSLLRWMSPEEIVRCSLRDLQKNKVICIPGWHAKLLIRLINMLPTRCYDYFVRKTYYVQQTLGPESQRN